MSIGLPRTVKLGSYGTDVDGHGRAMHRYLEDGQLGAYTKQPTRMRRTFGTGKRSLAKRCASKAGLFEYGVVGPALYAKMQAAGAYDAKANALVREYGDKQNVVVLALVYPIALPGASICQGYHITAGLAGNVAFDFCCQPNSKVVAPEAGKIRKLSGRSPFDDTYDSFGVYGWSIHLETASGYRYYMTHMGHRESLSVGQWVKSGQLLGHVGDQKFRPDHLHLGVTSPYGTRDAYKRMTAVSRAPRVRA